MRTPAAGEDPRKSGGDEDPPECDDDPARSLPNFGRQHVGHGAAITDSQVYKVVINNHITSSPPLDHATRRRPGHGSLPDWPGIVKRLRSLAAELGHVVTAGRQGSSSLVRIFLQIESGAPLSRPMRPAPPRTRSHPTD